MVISSFAFSAAAALTAASLLNARTSRPAKAARLPIAARNHRGPALSAKAARVSPSIKSAVLDPLMITLTCLSSADFPGAMLASTSDNGTDGVQPAAAELASGGLRYE